MPEWMRRGMDAANYSHKAKTLGKNGCASNWPDVLQTMGKKLLGCDYSLVQGVGQGSSAQHTPVVSRLPRRDFGLSYSPSSHFVYRVSLSVSGWYPVIKPGKVGHFNFGPGSDP